jgi:rod shape-determining protein MreC
MSLGTLDRTPPPFFRQGPSALTKLVVCAALALFLMVADSRFAFVVPLRAGLATALAPLQRALRVPGEVLAGGAAYLGGLEQARETAAQARRELALLAAQADRAAQLERENRELRELLALAPAVVPHHQAAEVLYEARDVFSRKIVIDRGQTHGVRAGSPVIDPAGLLGQVTRVYALSSEVTLLVDKDAAVPVLNRRSGQRGVVLGGARGPGGMMLEQRFLAANADVAAGDPLVTGGLDGVFPPGLPVATVASVERPAEGGFARVLATPAASADDVRHVLVLDPVGLPAPAASAAAASAPASAGAPAAAGRRSAP